MAREPLGGCLLIALALAGCGGDKPAEPAAANPQPATTPAAMKPSPAADSAARTRFLTCTDSVKSAMEKTADGRKKLAVEPPSGMIRPEFLAACGKPPATAVAEASKASASMAGPGSAAPAQTAGLSAKQLQVLKADSVRKAHEQAKADSLTRHSTLAKADSAKRAVADSTRSDSLRKLRENEVLRETFSYTGSARDPFQSLLASAKVGPEIGDLLLVGIYQDLRYASNSVAVLRDKGSGRRYKLRVGDQLGRLKVAQIRERDVVFTVEDFGYERQETLSLKKREADTQ